MVAKKKVAKKKAAKKRAAAPASAAPSIRFETLAAGYEAYPQSFSNTYFSAANVRNSVKNIKNAGFTRANLTWGMYQKFAALDPRDMNNWGDVRLYMNWESAIDHAREDLAKIPVDRNLPGPDPDNPTVRSRNMLEHLDTAVKIALFDKHQVGSPNESGIEVEVRVSHHAKHNRRHVVSTYWRRTATSPGDAKYNWDKLTIVMTCPTGGWIGKATWNYSGPSRFTKFMANLTVPPRPQNQGQQILFIFAGLESRPDPQRSHPPAILQPVLQWTPGVGYAVRSWYVPSTYTPTIDQMPDITNIKAFTTPDNPAWTEAVPVRSNQRLQSVIEWDGMAYRARFEGFGKTELLARNILPLTYPVAVMEAYNFSGRQQLVDATMTGLTLLREDAGATPVEPTWEVGTDAAAGDGIHHGTGRLHRYVVTVRDNNSTLIFTRKP